MYLCCLFVKCERMSSDCKSPVSQTESVVDLFDFDGTVHEESVPQGLLALTLLQLFCSVDG